MAKTVVISDLYLKKKFQKRIYRLSISSNRIIYKNNEFTFQVFSQDSKAYVSFQTKGATEYIYVDPEGKECEGEGCGK